jgi:hypothetical protein
MNLNRLDELFGASPNEIDLDLKIQYNKLIGMVWEYSQYMDNQNIKQEEKEKYLREYKLLIDKLNLILLVLPHSEKEIENGFEIYV